MTSLVGLNMQAWPVADNPEALQR